MMTHTEAQLIRANTTHLEAKVSEYKIKIKQWQNKCSHDLVQGEYKSDKGNYDSQDDSYWIIAKCLDCGKHLHAEFGTDLYTKLKLSGMISNKYDSKESIIKQNNIRLELEKQRLIDDNTL